MYKNVASQLVIFQAWDTSVDNIKSGDAANFTVQISKDGGSFATATNTASELGSTGIYKVTLTQTETNADIIAIRVTSSTANIFIDPIVIYTKPQTPDVNIIQISGDSTAADNCESFFDGTGYAGTGNTIPTVTTVTNVTNTVSANVVSMAANTLTASALANDAVTEIQTSLATLTALGTVAADLGVVASNVIEILDDTGTNGVVVASGSKTGYSLSSSGLDSISITAPTSVATNFREMMVQVWRRYFKKATMTTTELKTFADNGSTVITTQTVSDDGTTQTVNAAS